MVSIIDIMRFYIMFRMLRYMFLAYELSKAKTVELYQIMYFVDIMIAFMLLVQNFS
ncbi:MAG: hypothetical protein ACRCXX_13960 [Cetobacterium sp.]|uniref:hypothetical protein n=1 Tax=Cetobacterium sp. TaxID=2071632 RepID=UPI003F3F3253